MATTVHPPLLRRLGTAAAAGLLASAIASAADEKESLIADRLLAVSHVKECRVTTVGRRSGNPHTVTTWFVVDGDTVYLATLDESRDWVRNARAKGEVGIDFGPMAVTGTFEDVTDPQVAERIDQALRRKYWMAWIGGWFGRGPDAVFRVTNVRLLDAGSPSPRLTGLTR